MLPIRALREPPGPPPPAVAPPGARAGNSFRSKVRGGCPCPPRFAGSVCVCVCWCVECEWGEKHFVPGTQPTATQAQLTHARNHEATHTKKDTTRPWQLLLRPNPQPQALVSPSVPGGEPSVFPPGSIPLCSPGPPAIPPLRTPPGPPPKPPGPGAACDCATAAYRGPVWWVVVVVEEEEEQRVCVCVCVCVCLCLGEKRRHG
jgi:hypothetical protein